MSNAKTLEPQAKGASAKEGPKQNLPPGIVDAATLPKPEATVASGRKAVDPNEPPDKKFKRLAVKRMTKAIKSIGYVGNLGNKRQYQYTPEQRQKILDSLHDAIDDVARKFSDETQRSESFSL